MLSHTLACYIINNCTSISLFLNSFAHPFPKIKGLVFCLYKIHRVKKEIALIDWAIRDNNINMLYGTTIKAAKKNL